MGRHVAIAPIMPRLIDATTAAAYVGRGITKFLEQVKRGELPGPSDRNGNVDLWDVRALDRYIDRRSGFGSPLQEWD